LSTLQIGAAGVLLIQYRLLRIGIESAPMTTDTGIDLVAYSSTKEEAVTIQVKTCLKPKPAGGKGRLTLDWWLRSDSPAKYVGVVNLEGDQVWLFGHDDFVRAAQQKPEGRLHFYFYVDADYPAKPGCHERDFRDHLIERAARKLIDRVLS
jgi:hypothetical protein